MDHAEYCGAIQHLRGKTALVQPASEEGFLLAQFDERHLTLPDTRTWLGHGWHRFPTSDFLLLVPICWG